MRIHRTQLKACCPPEGLLRRDGCQRGHVPRPGYPTTQHDRHEEDPRRLARGMCYHHLLQFVEIGFQRFAGDWISNGLTFKRTGVSTITSG